MTFTALPHPPSISSTPAGPHSNRKKVCIIGGGASGLSLLPLALQQDLVPTLYEARESTGGAWVFDPEPGRPRFHFHPEGLLDTIIGSKGDDFTPMYPGLRANVPISLMQYRGQPFKNNVPLFPCASHVADYLDDVASGYSQYIKVSHRVTSLRYTTPQDGGKQLRWLVQISSQNGKIHSTEQFDFVAIANGHYSKPYVPSIEGLHTFAGDLWHSKWWRKPDEFADKVRLNASSGGQTTLLILSLLILSIVQTVLVVGNGASGFDVARELAVAISERRIADPSAALPRLYQSSRSTSPVYGIFDTASEWSKEIVQVPAIRRIEAKRIEMDDETSIEDVDVIIFATGYYLAFPFCSPTHEPFASHPLTQAPEGGLRVHHLDDRDLFYLPDTTLALLGLPYLVLPFSLAQIQSLLAAHHWSSSNPPLDIIPGVPESEPEDRKLLVYGHPKQFDRHDQWLLEMGKGANLPDDDFWCKTPASMRDLRVGGRALRKGVLGY
ncbi:BQ2448_5633 [Microbotryum intermedium]|uniref:BQ2448_5633 protein n=1 Tax=Microbotryum intermedium TaxID=269621 RepID=A0A238F1R8_9BASI|nr:BQ2448_5633 [Microbotryum intermedium]